MSARAAAFAKTLGTVIVGIAHGTRWRGCCESGSRRRWACDEIKCFLRRGGDYDMRRARIVVLLAGGNFSETC